MMPTHAWSIADRPGAKLMIGIPDGQQRPALWIMESHGAVILARFYGEKHAMVAVHFLDSMTDSINRVIQHYADLNGDETA